MSNPYYSPEALGLTIVGSAEDASAGGGFDEFMVWKDADGNYYWASDSGCSCPAPFDDVTPQRATLAEIHAALDEWASYGDKAEGAAELHLILAREG